MKPANQQLAWNMGFALALNLTLRAAGTLAFIAIGRLGTTSDAGAFSLAIGYLAILTTLFTSLDDVLVRECARVTGQAWSLIFTYGCIRFVLSVLGWLILLTVLAGFSLYSPNEFWTLAIITSSALLDAFNGIAQAALNAQDHFGWPLVASALGTLVKLAGVLFALINHASVGVLAIAWPVGSALSAILLVSVLLNYLAKRGEQFTWTLDQHWLRELARIVPAFTITSLLSGLEYQLDVIFISILLSNHAVAVYSAATTIMMVVLTISQAYRAVLYPKLVRSLKGPPQVTNRLIVRSLLLMGGLAFLAAIIVATAAPLLISILFGARFVEAGPVLQVLIWNVVLFYLNVPLVRFMLASDGQSTVWRTVLISLTVNVVANLWAIPHLGVVGAAYVRLLSSSVFCGLTAWQVSLRLRHRTKTALLIER